MPNLWGATPVGREEGDRSYMARTIGKGRPNQRCYNRGGVLGAQAKVTEGAGRAGEVRGQAGRSIGARTSATRRERECDRESVRACIGCAGRTVGSGHA